ncbi:patatin-like phospholipase family protein [Carboxylicivirga sp. N1Y90]|uniref:patatin-like phospholipase family protein n=1 Tax=Carboxylicivirga fragile TaxID=3417571 RepID=UPI003D324AC9|nr:patatin-like phospholipase family protein [Marinilabiliaceae bacterium N1Y90]
MKIIQVLLFLALFTFPIKTGFAQEKNERPKIGLVLSGGGAKGLAHIGVIKVLEEAGIRPDYIAGTSMGSIVGGLYASGYTAAEMDSIVRAADWSVVLSDQVALTDVVPVEKGDYDRFQLEFDITKKGLKLPSGVVRGQRISELLSELTWRVSDVEDFDDLPIPFRCVAADLLSGRTHVFEDGNLMLAMRASMAIPSVFTPVEVGDMYLVDGGVLDNFPVKVCLDMGADIIIGVNVGFKDYPTKEDMNSLPKVLLNAASIGSNPAQIEASKLCDYLVAPELEPYGTSSFDDGIHIIERGEIAAREQMDLFNQLADSINNLGKQPFVPRHFVSKKILVKDIHIQNRNNVSLNFFHNHLGFEAGDSIEVEQINEGVNRLMGTRFYKKITYELNKESDDFILIFDTKEAHQAKAKFSLRYDNELKAGLVTNLTIRNLLVKNSRLALTADISEDPRLSANLLAYIGEKQKVGLLSEFYFERTPLPLYADNAKKHGILNYNLNTASVGAFITIKNHTMLTANLYWKETIASQRSGIPELFENEINHFGNGFFQTKLALDANTLNKRFFANRGHLFNLSLYHNYDSYERYSGKESSKVLIIPYVDVPSNNYIKGKASFQKFFALSSRFDMNIELASGAFSHDAPFFDMFYVGGTQYNKGTEEIPFAGLNYREKIIENFAFAGTELNFKIKKVLYAHIITNAIYSANFGNSHFGSNSVIVPKNELIIGASAGLAINSVIGPITVGVGTNANDFKLRTYVNIGYPFH